jgi:hypothetical protein
MFKQVVKCNSLRYLINIISTASMPKKKEAVKPADGPEVPIHKPRSNTRSISSPTRTFTPIEQNNVQVVQNEINLSQLDNPATEQGTGHPITSLLWKVSLFRDGILFNTIRVSVRITRELELKYRENADDFDFKANMPSLPDGVTAEYSRTRIIMGNEVIFPKEWIQWQSITCHLYTINSSSDEYIRIEDSIKKTLPNAKINSIMRIQNLFHYRKYYLETLKILANCGLKYEDLDIVEKFLFHGTGNTPPNAIIPGGDGFDTRLSGDYNLWGPASYFAEDASYSDIFAYHAAGIRHLFVASVLVGSSYDFGCMKKFSQTRPPIDVINKMEFHSISGFTNDSRIYGVFNSNQAIPRYLIKYTVTE